MTEAPSFDPSTIPEGDRASFLALSDEEQREHLAAFVDSGDLASAFTYAKLNPPRFQEILSRLGNPRSGTTLDDALFKILDSANNNAVEAVVEALDVDPGGTVLELGFGGGYGIELAAGRGLTVSGVEYSEAMVEAAAAGRARRAIEAGQASLRRGDALNLPFDDDSFDAVYHVNCFYFWSDLARGVSECFRVLRPGGLMVTGSKLGQTDSLLGADRAYDPEGIFANTDEDAYIEILKSSGFTDIAVEQREGLPGQPITAFTLIRSRHP